MSAADSFKLSNKGLSYRFGVLKLRIGGKVNNLQWGSRAA